MGLVVAPMPTSNEIQSGGEQFSNEQSSSPLNYTDNPGSFVVGSGKCVVSLTCCTVL